MKQPKVQLPFPPIAPPAAIIGPRYRYFSEPPAFVSVRAGDLAAVPADCRASTYEPGRFIELPSEEVLKGPMPRISLARLAELAPESFIAKSFNISVPVPPSVLARSYKLVQRQELIEDVPAVTALAAEELAEEKFAPPVAFESAVAAEKPPFSIEEPKDFAPPAFEEPPMVQEAPAEPPYFEEASASPTEPVEFSPPAPPAIPTAITQPPQPSQAPPQPPRRLFSMMPMFRRKIVATSQPAPSSPPIVPPPPAASEASGEAMPRRPRVELPPPKIHLTPLAPVSEAPWEKPFDRPPASYAPEAVVEEPLSPPPFVEEAIPEPPIFEDPFIPEPPQAQIPIPPPPVIEPERSAAVLVETEHLPKTPSGETQLAYHEDLQALFMTEEMLSVDRVIELCGGLPGISSCVLSHGSSVVASHNVPESLDLVSLSAHAVEMLRAMKASSAKMGVGAIPAVTIHAEKGPITFFNQEDICLLVLHKDRGFVPGVREKLQSVVTTLSKANLPRPLPSPPGSRILEG